MSDLTELTTAELCERLNSLSVWFKTRLAWLSTRSGVDKEWSENVGELVAEARSRLDALRWRDVSEEVPEINIRVFVRQTPSSPVEIWTRKDKWHCINDKISWVDDDGFCMTAKPNTTWMPIPREWREPEREVMG